MGIPSSKNGIHLEDIHDHTCLFCAELETTQHLFFDCLVARILWSHLSEMFNVTLGSNLEHTTSFWGHNKRFEVINMTTAGVLWSLWKCQNNLFFRSSSWSSMQVLCHVALRHLRSWTSLCSSAGQGALEHILQQLEGKSVEIPRLLPG
ncbi:hypothetical protein BRADI_2g37672v3 [Brachypodium distachyon]|uniref:Reverse transcriptase zinc-binding domain-containing protein n=1 Tax=Brachypodium distachyon TaxID=15368 RepID=A0A0Q3R2U1_BRADI|nr:hypothetical protein BRADI_2g37672v3 [Brachypodium distachyon]